MRRADFFTLIPEGADFVRSQFSKATCWENSAAKRAASLFAAVLGGMGLGCVVYPARLVSQGVVYLCKRESDIQHIFNSMKLSVKFAIFVIGQWWNHGLDSFREYEEACKASLGNEGELGAKDSWRKYVDLTRSLEEEKSDLKKDFRRDSWLVNDKPLGNVDGHDASTADQEVEKFVAVLNTHGISQPHEQAWALALFHQGGKGYTFEWIEHQRLFNHKIHQIDQTDRDPTIVTIDSRKVRVQTHVPYHIMTQSSGRLCYVVHCELDICLDFANKTKTAHCKAYFG